MIVARLVPPGQSTPGPDARRAWRQRERKHIIGQRGARQPARVTSGSSAPPAASRPRATSADHSAGPPLGRSQCSARRGDSPVPRGRGLARQRPLQAPSTRCSASAASAAPASARLTHLCRSDGGTQNSRIPSLPQTERPPAHGVHNGGSVRVLPDSARHPASRRRSASPRGQPPIQRRLDQDS
jgi:hypothetical protein